MKILFKYPTRSRPEKFFETLDLYYKYLSEDADFNFVITLDKDDESMNTYQIRQALSDGKKYPNLYYNYEMSKNKIDAINRDMDSINDVIDWDILVLVSDDMIPQVEGFDKHIVKEMQINFIDTDGVLHFNDGYLGSKLNTLVVMGRKYYDRFGYIYHSDYTSLWSDNEFMEVSKKLNKTVYLNDVIIKHEHPANNLMIKSDEQYKKTESYYQQDKKVFDNRKSLNFGL